MAEATITTAAVAPLKDIFDADAAAVRAAAREAARAPVRPLVASPAYAEVLDALTALKASTTGDDGLSAYLTGAVQMLNGIKMHSI